MHKNLNRRLTNAILLGISVCVCSTALPLATLAFTAPNPLVLPPDFWWLSTVLLIGVGGIPLGMLAGSSYYKQRRRKRS